MSWSESYPLFDDDHVDRFDAEASADERALTDAYFSIRKSYNTRRSKRILSASLGRPPLPGNGSLEDSLAIDENRAVEDAVQGLVDKAIRLDDQSADLTLRVYLASDLEDFVPDLVDAGWEVHLMHEDSSDMTLVSLWKLLAFEEAGLEITISSSEAEGRVEADLRRTSDLVKAGLGFWRVPFVFPETPNGDVHYRPISGHQYGGVGGMNISVLLRAFVWHCRWRSFAATTALPGCGTGRLPWAAWSGRYFCEWFLAAAVYPRVVEAGILTFLSSTTYSPFLALDIEYATWANPNAQLIVTPGAHCCGAGLASDADQVTSETEVLA